MKVIRMARRSYRRPVRNAAELGLAGALLVLASLFPLVLAYAGFTGIATHSDPAGLATCALFVGLIGLAAFGLGAACLNTAIRGEAR